MDRSAVSAADWLGRVLAEDADRLTAALAMAEADEPDAVHQVRVACRRGRSHLTTLAVPLGVRGARKAAKRLKKVAQLCAEARDLEVLREVVGEHPEVGPAVAEQEQAALRQAKADLQGDLTESARVRLRTVIGRTGELEPGPAAPAIRPLVDRAWDALAEAADPLRPESPDSAWHTARVRAKAARYTAEAAAPVLGESTQARAKAAKRAQTVLGKHQDVVMAADRLEAMGSPEARRLAERHRGRRPALRREFLTCWADVAGRGDAWRSASSR